MPEPTVFVVIASHNRRGLTLRCMDLLGRQSYSALRVVLVDDGSTDGTREEVRRRFPEVAVLEGDGNLWWTAATNMGVGLVLEAAEPRDYVLTLNDDADFDECYVERMVRTALRYPGALVGSTAVEERDRQTVLDGGVRMRWVTAEQIDLAAGLTAAELSVAPDLPIEVDVLSGRGALVPVAVFRQVGLYDAQRLPHYAADYEFSRRAARAGYPLLVDHRAFVYTKGRNADEEPAPLTASGVLAKLFSRRSPANLRYQYRYARLVCPWYVVPLYVIGYVFRMLAASLDRRLGRSQ